MPASAITAACAEEVPVLFGAGAFVHGAGDLAAEAGGAVDGSHHVGDGDVRSRPRLSSTLRLRLEGPGGALDLGDCRRDRLGVFNVFAQEFVDLEPGVVGGRRLGRGAAGLHEAGLGFLEVELAIPDVGRCQGDFEPRGLRIGLSRGLGRRADDEQSRAGEAEGERGVEGEGKVAVGKDGRLQLAGGGKSYRRASLCAPAEDAELVRKDIVAAAEPRTAGARRARRRSRVAASFGGEPGGLSRSSGTTRTT